MKRFGKRLMALAVLVLIVAFAIGIASGFTTYPLPASVPDAARYGVAGGALFGVVGFVVGLGAWLLGVTTER
jgi:hypothetical protein